MVKYKFIYDDDNLKSLLSNTLERVLKNNLRIVQDLPVIFITNHFSDNNDKTDDHLFYVKINDDKNALCLEKLDNYYFPFTVRGIESLLYYIRILHLHSIHKKTGLNIDIFLNTFLSHLQSNDDFANLISSIKEFSNSDAFLYFKRENSSKISILFEDNQLYSHDYELIQNIINHNSYGNLTFNDINNCNDSFLVNRQIHSLFLYPISDIEYITLINHSLPFMNETDLTSLKLILHLLSSRLKNILNSNIIDKAKQDLINIMQSLPFNIVINKKTDSHEEIVFHNNPNQNIFNSQSNHLQVIHKVFLDNQYCIYIDKLKNQEIKLEKIIDKNIKEFDNIVDKLPMPVCIIDDAMEIIQFNIFFENLISKILNKFSRYFIMKLNNNQTFKGWKDKITNCFENDYEESFDSFTISGKRHFFLTKFFLIDNEEDKKVIIVMSDITDFTKLSQKVNSIEKQNIELIKLLPMCCVIFLDKNYKILMTSGSESKNIFLTTNHKYFNTTDKSIFSCFDDQTRCFLREHFAMINKKKSFSQDYYINNNHYAVNTKKITSLDNNEDLQVSYIMIFHNISQKMQLLEKVMDSEFKLNAFYQNSAIGMFKVSPQGKILKCNPAFCKMLKLPFDFKFNNISLFKDIYFNGKKSTEEEHLSLKNFNYNKKYLRYDKSIIYVIENLRPVYDSLKKIEYYEGTVINMTDIVNAKRNSYESELKYKLLADNQTDIILTLNNDFNLSYCSPAVEKILKFSVTEMYNIDLFGLIDANSIESLKVKNINEVKNLIDIQLSHKPHYSFEICLIDKMYKKQWVEVTVSRFIKDTNINLGYLFVLKDINDKKLIQNKLIITEDKYHSLFDYSPVGIMIINKKGIIIDSNPALLKLLKVDDLIGKNIFSFPVFERKLQYIIGTLDKFNKIVNFEIEYFSDNTGLLKNELNAYSEDNNLIYFNLNGSSFKGYEQDERLYFILVEDITKIRNYRSKIEKSLTEKEILLKEIHHRVKNNLQIVCSMLFLESNKSRSKKTIKALEESYNRIRSMAMIHEKLYSENSFDSIDLSTYVNDLINYLMKSLKPNDLDLKINCDIENIRLSVSQAISCGLILNELISNSIKYAFINSIKNSTDLQVKPMLIIKIKQENDLINLEVKDNGKLKNTVFNPFNKKTLGLHLVKTLVNQLHGKIIWSYSDGLLIRVCFPNENDINGGKSEKETYFNN